MSCAGRVLTVLVLTSCGGLAAKEGQGSAPGSAGLSSAGSALGGSAGAIAGVGGMGVGGQASVGGSASGVAGDANLAGEGGSSGAPADHCAGPLNVADPDVERTLREQIGKPTGPMYTADFASVTDLGFLSILGAEPQRSCSTTFDCPIPEPPASDGWVTSLAGLECLPHVQQVELDAWYVTDFSPLAAISELTRLDLGLSAELSHLSILPQLRELTVSYSDGDLTGLAAVRNLTSFSGHFKDLSAKNALAPLGSLKGLRNLVLAKNKITDVSGLEALSELVTVDLSNNNIRDLSPLLQNTALGSSTTIDISENPISCGDPSVAALLARKVNVKLCGP
jgi:Leucine Rich repeats (2 copies)